MLAKGVDLEPEPVLKRGGHRLALKVDVERVGLGHCQQPLDLLGRQPDWADAGLLSVRAIGDAWAPATIAAAVWSGHRYAEELDEPQPAGPVPYLREVTELASEPVMYLPITPVEPARV